MSKTQPIEDFLIRVSTDHRVHQLWDPVNEYVYYCRLCDQRWANEGAAQAHIVKLQAADIEKALRAVFEDGYDAAHKDYDGDAFKPNGHRQNPYGVELTENDELRIQFGRRVWTKPLWAHVRKQK